MFDFIKVKEEDPNKIYSIIQKIHSNNNKYELYKVKHKKTGEIYAAKIIKDYTNNHLEKIKLLKKFESPYIVQFYQSYIINNTIWIITEFCNCGSTLDIMKITNKCYKETEIASIIVMVLKGLQYLHLQKKYHGGIKPSNILINNEGVAKLSDFNMSSKLFNHNHNNNNNIYTTPPELIKNNNYSIKSDIWYLGLTCIELAEGTIAFNNNIKEKDKINGIKNKNLWSLEFIDFIRKCLNENPLNRPSAAILINHPFITNNNKGKIIIKKKINNIKSLIDIYREKIDEQEEKNNINEYKDIGRDSLEITSFNENLSLSQSDDVINNNNNNSNINSNNIAHKKNNISLNINTNTNKNKSLLNHNKDRKEKSNKISKIKRIKISIKNTQIQNNNNNNNNNNINKVNGLIKINKEKTNSKKRTQNKTSSIKKAKISSFEIYDKIKHINGNISNDIILSKENNKNQKKRYSMINKYFKNTQFRNNIFINTKNNNTQENISSKNNLMKLLNKFEHDKMLQNKNVNKSQRIKRIENVFILPETPNNKKIKHKYNYSLKIANNKNNNILKDKDKDKNTKDNKSLSSIDSLRNSKNYKNSKNNNIDRKMKSKSKTRNKKSNGGNQNLSELIDSNKYGKKSSQKKNILLRNLILNNSNKNIITEENLNIKDADDSKISSNEKNINNNNIFKLNNSMNINNYRNIKKKEGYEAKLPDINNNNLNKNSKTPIVYFFKSGEIKRLKRPPLSHSNKKNNFSKKIKQIKKSNYKVNTSNINYTNANKDNDKSDYIDNINNTNYTYINNSKSNNQSYSYNRNDKDSLAEEELKLLCLNNKLNERGLPELITELAGLENKMNQEIQRIKDQYEPIIKQHKEGIKFLKQNPFLKNIKEYKNFENFKKKMRLTSMDDLENRSISSSVHNLNKIKISFYQSNDIEELNILANKYIFEKTGIDHHGLMEI